jgi:hypothetical protein
MNTLKNDQKQVAKERREALRHGADLTARFCVVSGESGKKTKEVPATVTNLSEAGFCLATEFTVIDDLHVLSSSSGISKNSLEINFQLPGEKEIRIVGTACWYNLGIPGGTYRYDVGTQIDEISESDMTLLKTFIRQERKGTFFKTLFGMKWLERLFSR